MPPAKTAAFPAESFSKREPSAARDYQPCEGDRQDVGGNYRHDLQKDRHRIRLGKLDDHFGVGDRRCERRQVRQKENARNDYYKEHARDPQTDRLERTPWRIIGVY